MDEQINEIKAISKHAKTAQELYNTLCERYERISNQPEKGYSKIYSLVDIIKSPVLCEIKHRDRLRVTVILEVANYPLAPNGIVITYSGFSGRRQTKWEMFV